MRQHFHKCHFLQTQTLWWSFSCLFRDFVILLNKPFLNKTMSFRVFLWQKLCTEGLESICLWIRSQCLFGARLTFHTVFLFHRSLPELPLQEGQSVWGGWEQQPHVCVPGPLHLPRCWGRVWACKFSTVFLLVCWSVETVNSHLSCKYKLITENCSSLLVNMKTSKTTEQIFGNLEERWNKLNFYGITATAWSLVKHSKFLHVSPVTAILNLGMVFIIKSLSESWALICLFLPLQVCGTDNKTYDTSCHFFATKCTLDGTKKGHKLHLDYIGPCKCELSHSSSWDS